MAVIECTLTDSIDLGSVTTTADTDTDIDAGELVKSNNEERLVDLESEYFWLDKGKGRSVDLDETTASLNRPTVCQPYSFFPLDTCTLMYMRTLQWATAVANERNTC